MEANELRIGNILNAITTNGIETINFYEIVVSEILTDGIREEKGLKFPYFTLVGAPLTEEWLLKFGLEKMKDSNTYEWKDGDYRNVQVDLKAKVAEIYLCGYDSVMASQCFPVDHIKYVHQLQNLFFALKGKELTLK